MSDIVSIQEILSSSADVALIIFLYFVWRLDRRILVLEERIKTIFNKLERAAAFTCPYDSEKGK